jgi:type IV pilus assembly protein PilY1
LRGDQSNEGTKGLQLYRPRETLLGDIVNSAPAFVKAGIDLSYELLPLNDTDKAAYRTHVNTKKARTEGVVFVGANDGMLHGFRDGTTATVALSGREVFAYIPRAVLPNLHLLADKNYTHRYYVDGPNVETDALFGAGTWKNLLVGTTGAGAKAVYALDVSNPLAMTAGSVLWEISPSTNANFAGMGHVLSDVQMGRTPSGDWVAIFGNGYDNASGFARLYIVNLLDGTYIKDIAVGVAGGNGLGAVRLVRDDKQQVIGAYAGDLKGKMWKFDLTGATSASWQVGLNGQPLYDAGTTKPITARPVVIANPTGGNVVAFATGKLFEEGDLDTLTTQTVYGVLDDIPFGSPTSVMTAVVQSNLVQQTIGGGTILTVTFTASDLTLSSKTIVTYPITRNTVTFSASVRGWFVNLTQDGQRTVYPLDLLANRFVAVDTISPVGVNTSNACIQGASGSGVLYFIDGLTGGGATEPIIDTDGNGLINAIDGTVSGISSIADGRNLVAPVDSKTSGTQIGYVVCSGGSANCTEITIPCRATNTCPAPNVRSREWRQLFMR